MGLIEQIKTVYSDNSEALKAVLRTYRLVCEFEPESIQEHVLGALTSYPLIFLAEVYGRCPDALQAALISIEKTAIRINIGRQYKVEEVIGEDDPGIENMFDGLDKCFESLEKGESIKEQIVEQEQEKQSQNMYFAN